jgi:hypothetical protein
MSTKDCCSEEQGDCKVTVVVEVNKIIKYLSIAAVVIVGIIFGTRTFTKMLQHNFFKR